MWTIKKVADIPKLKKPVLIEGLPGIANVGKIAVDFLVEVKKAKKVIELHSDSLPHSVFVNDDGLVELPRLEIYLYQQKSQDFLFLVGGLQPMNETSCYDLCKTVLKFLKENGGKEVVTTGGIGLPRLPLKPRVFCTANTRKIITRYKKNSKRLNENSQGVIDSVVGVAGLLLGLAKDYDIEAIGLLAETFAYPFYMGVSGAREILMVLEENFKFKINLKELDMEIRNIETEIMNLSKNTPPKKDVVERDKFSYIG